MAPITSSDSAGDALEPWRAAQRLEHAGCFACDTRRPTSLGRECQRQPDGSVAGLLEPQLWLQGYTDQDAWGLVVTLLDRAMTQGVFGQGVTGVTATLHVRYRVPVGLTHPLQVTAVLGKKDPRVYDLAAELDVDGRCGATAKAKLMAKTSLL